ncbi:MAG: hypothetical protein M3Y49_05935 [Actinomycetota bacterium]|nr:hypothetical protein [Actinomycetota bacterium]
MAFGTSREDKEADARRLAALSEKRRLALEGARTEANRQAAIDLPIGQAVAAKEERQGFFEIQLQVGFSQRDPMPFGATAVPKDVRTQSHAGTLAAIEAIGWKLEHVGYVFVVTGENSRANFLVSGQNVAVSGETVGIYLFRNTDPA